MSVVPASTLRDLLRPASVAVVGASARPESYGYKTLSNLIDFGFAGPLYPINPRAEEIRGLRCYPSLEALPEVPDCLVVALPAEKALSALEEGARHGARAAVVFASGFAESGEAGRERQRQLQRLAVETGMVVCGPNGLGFVNVRDRVAAYGAPVPEGTRAGDVAVVSQSGSVCILFNSLERFGFTYLVSSGNQAVVDLADYVGFLAEDDETRVIACYIESVPDPERLAAAAEQARAAGKHLVALKVGRSERGLRVTAAHTGALATPAAVAIDFLERCGFVAVHDLDELIEAVTLVRGADRPLRDAGVAILNVSGGENSLICDLAEDVGLELAPLASATRDSLAALLPEYASADNPFDAGAIMFDGDAYGAAVAALAGDPGVGVLAVCQDCPSGLGTDEAAIYRGLMEIVAEAAPGAPAVVAVFSSASGATHPGVAEPLTEASVPLLQGARPTLGALAAIQRAARAAEPDAGVEQVAADPEWQRRFEDHRPLSEDESKAFVAAHGLPVPRSVLARTREDAVAAAESIGFPVVLKVSSSGVLHKTEAGGVRVGVADAGEVARAFDEIVASVARVVPDALVDGVIVEQFVAGGVEALVGVTASGPFGHALVVGVGGTLAELVDDSALAVLPVGAARAGRLVQGTRLAALLAGHRGSARADADALVALVARVAAIAAAYGDLIEAVDLNPVAVLAEGSGVCVLDALVIPRKGDG